MKGNAKDIRTELSKTGLSTNLSVEENINTNELPDTTEPKLLVQSAETAE